MVTSINTNSGALQSLSSLRQAQSALDVSSKKVQTGKRVADAFDDASVFAVAQGISSVIKQDSAVQQSLSGGLGLGAVAGAALNGVSDLIGDIKAKITQLSDGSLSSAQVATYSQDLFKQLSQVSSYVNEASYNGRNILTNTASTSFVADASGTTISLSSQASNVSSSFNTFSGAAAAFTSAVLANPGTAAAITAINNSISTFEASINQAQGTIGAETNAINSQQNFINNLRDAATIGLGAQVDADLAAEASNQRSRQVGAQLASYSLSIANQQPGGLLGLFR